MLATLFLVGAALFGACLVRRVLGRLLDGAETVMCGAVAGWALSTVFVYALARRQGQLTHTLMLWATAAAWLAAAVIILLQPAAEMIFSTTLRQESLSASSFSRPRAPMRRARARSE
ncbi:MAG TPA: hypothetical protein VHU19_02135 [Pyrinomonadaceae bacterium]|nr:hypothetical protein [Pyrinomonadaceae bacterium]